MNNLSWFLYFADVSPTLSETLGVFGWLVVFIALTVFTFRVMTASENDEVTKPKARNFFKTLLFGVFLVLMAAFLPSKETIYLIAGSEAGEYVVQSEQGQEILNDIHQVIKYQLQQMQGETND